ncbi:MAG: response regulator, partial [Desulfobacterales bacterium]|nr:response regulator [Desulfobacterales bacterium]
MQDPAQKRKMKLLIAEDERISRRILEAHLAKWGYRFDSVEDGAAAWEKLRSEPAPRLAVLDWAMPKMDGVEICRKLRRLKTPLPTYIILLTARTDRKEIVEGLEAGADDYIVKPFKGDELRARLEVGRRVIELQDALARQEKLKGIYELAGAVCHELNQPMQAISWVASLMLMKVETNNPLYEHIETIKEQVDKMASITKNIRKITSYKTKAYFDSTIVDIN